MTRLQRERQMLNRCTLGIVVLAILGALLSCSPATRTEVSDVEWVNAGGNLTDPLWRIHDREAGVTCWRTNSSASVFCVPDSQLGRPAAERAP